MDRYRSFEHIERTKRANRYESAGLEIPFDIDQLAISEKCRDKLVQKYGKSYIKNWSGKTLEKIFSDLGREQAYLSHFRTASNFTHPTYLAISQCRMNAGSHASWTPTSGYARAAALISTGSLINIAQDYSRFHSVSDMETLFLEINWNVLSRFIHDGENIDQALLKGKEPVPENTWGVFNAGVAE